MSSPPPLRRRALLVLAGGTLVAASVLVIPGGRISPGERSSPARAVVAEDSGSWLLEAESLPAPPGPALAVARPRPLADVRYVTRWASIVKPTTARSSPIAHARAVASLETRTYEGTANIVVVLRSVRDRTGNLWVRTRIPGLPSQPPGWIRRDALGAYHTVRTRLVVDLRKLTATLYSKGQRLFQARVGIGKSGTPTPAGEFYIRDRLDTLDTPVYGPLAFGTSVRSAVLTDWPGGGFIGIHGTNEPGILPGEVSHGCIRLRNADILRLGRLMPVGTRLTVVA